MTKQTKKVDKTPKLVLCWVGVSTSEVSMSGSMSRYAVGYGRPPLHTRFQKGQSGNPSGKPGPAKLAKQRFERALFAALDGNEAELEHAKPGTLMAGVARRLAREAVSGRIPAIRLLL